MGFQFKVKLSALMAVINGVAAGLSYTTSQGDLTVTIVCTAISIGITQGISYYTDYQPCISNGAHDAAIHLA